MNRSKAPLITIFLLMHCMLFYSSGVNAQNVVEKVVYSLEENSPLENAHILTSDTVVFTTPNGRFKLNFDEYLEIFHIGYQSVRFERMDEIPDTIWMIRRNNTLDEITIRAERVIEEIEKEPKYWIKNFEVIYDHLVVLKKTHLRGNTKLSLYDLEGNYLNAFFFDHKIQDIIINCIGQLLVKYKNGYVVVFVSDGKIIKGPKYSRKTFRQVFGNCVLYHDKQWIYEFQRYNGLEKSIVSIKENKDSLLKKISLPQLIELKNNYREEIAYGSNVGTITTNDPSINRRIRRAQSTGDFLDKVLLKVHEKNSFAIMNEGILIANAVLDSLHLYTDEIVEKKVSITKWDKIFNDTNTERAFFLQYNGMKDYVLNVIKEDLNFKKVLTINEHVLKVRVCGNKVYYLVRDDRTNSVIPRIYFETI
ncbi:MAG: hypothetical protein AAGA77_16505 [Bacteroidota bacterium]